MKIFEASHCDKTQNKRRRIVQTALQLYINNVLTSKEISEPFEPIIRKILNLSKMDWNQEVTREWFSLNKSNIHSATHNWGQKYFTNLLDKNYKILSWKICFLFSLLRWISDNKIIVGKKSSLIDTMLNFYN